MSYQELMFKSVVHAPVHSPETILDIGCGTAYVTHHLATTYPSARVYGLDISPIPELRPKSPNMTFVEGELRAVAGSDERFGSEKMDYIFHRLLICGMTEWLGYVRLVAGMLRPGGWVEMQDTSWDLMRDGRTISDGWEWLGEVRKGAERKGLDIYCGKKIAGWMKRAGLVDVKVIEYETPVGTWEVDKRPETRKLGEYYERWLVELYWHLIPRLLGEEKSAQEIERLRLQMKEDLKPEEGKYWVFYVTIGKKPELSQN